MKKAFLLLLLLLANLASCTAGVLAFNRTDLFVNGASYGISYPCYRQPAIIRTNNVVIAFAEGRNVSSCAPPVAPIQQPPPSNEVGGLVIRRSVDEGEQPSWEEAQTFNSSPLID